MGVDRVVGLAVSGGCLAAGVEAREQHPREALARGRESMRMMLRGGFLYSPGLGAAPGRTPQPTDSEARPTT